MIDGININSTISNFDVWRQAVPFQLLASVDTFETGLISTKKRGEKIITVYRAKFETYDLTVKQVTYKGKNLYYLNIKGSLHKNHFGGSNYLPFTWIHLQKEIEHLSKNLHFNPLQAKISGLEIGVNIYTPFPVHAFIMQNIINYKGNSFIRWDKDKNKGISLGKYSETTQYKVKVYDKGLQNNLTENLLRFELSYFKMQQLTKRGIKNLTDLQDFKKVKNLGELLFKAWNEVLIFDILQPLKKLPIKDRERIVILEGKDPVFWELLKEQNEPNHFKYCRTVFKSLVAKFGKKWQLLALDLITKEWQNLTKNYPNLPTVKSELLPVLTIKIKGKNGEKIITPLKRYCLTCNKELHPDQKKESKYCSSLFVGEKLAHQCRNRGSNPGNNFKKKLSGINARGVLFDIMPYFISKAQLMKQHI